MSQDYPLPVASSFRLGENLLLGGNILLIFCLIFESYLQIPIWLTPIGRMHPLILHFPIVLVLLLVLVEVGFHSWKGKNSPEIRLALRGLFLVAALSTVLAATMGLFLSIEEGYTGQLLVQHKWSGSFFALLLAILYWARYSLQAKLRVMQVSYVLAALCLTFTSHLGATLTHGENFLFASLQQQNEVQVAFEEALVFDHMVKPILERKCNSCHNPRKSKGELIMTTQAGILEGGKSGRLLEAGSVEKSLMLQRIHLPLEDEEHMPPKGKTQLTPEEIRLLELWIAAQAPFDTRVASLDPQEELFQVASLRFESADSQTEYTFAAASSSVVEKLNTAVRSVLPLAKNSPALEARIYSRAEFAPALLHDLSDVKTQLVALNLSEMPVTDQDLSIIAQFENLNRLNLNFTDITGTGLQHLQDIPTLKRLSLAGTKVNMGSLRSFLSAKRDLASLYLWNSTLTDEEIGELRREFKQVAIEDGKEGEEIPRLKLNLPVLGNTSPIFADSMVLNLKHPIRDVEIRYTLDGTEPDSVRGLKYEQGKIIVNSSAQIRARAYKEGWYGSDMASLRVYQNRFKPDTVHLLSRMNRVHPANGAYTFFDGEMGSFNANSPAWANNWAGFLQNNMELLFEYKEAVPISSIEMRVLVEPENVIFPPALLEVWAGDHPDQLTLMARSRPQQPTQLGKPYIDHVSISMPVTTTRYIKVIAQPVEKIADWSPRQGRPALLLVDEIFVN